MSTPHRQPGAAADRRPRVRACRAPACPPAAPRVPRPFGSPFSVVPRAEAPATEEGPASPGGLRSPPRAPVPPTCSPVPAQGLARPPATGSPQHCSRRAITLLARRSRPDGTFQSTGGSGDTEGSPLPRNLRIKVLNIFNSEICFKMFYSSILMKRTWQPPGRRLCI